MSIITEHDTFVLGAAGVERELTYMVRKNGHVILVPNFLSKNKVECIRKCRTVLGYTRKVVVPGTFYLTILAYDKNVRERNVRGWRVTTHANEDSTIVFRRKVRNLRQIYIMRFLSRIMKPGTYGISVYLANDRLGLTVREAPMSIDAKRMAKYMVQVTKGVKA